MLFLFTILGLALIPAHFIVDDVNASFFLKDKEAFLAAKDDLPAIPKSFNGVFHIPEKITYENESYVVTKIGIHAFSGTAIKNVVIPKTITTIQEGAFQNINNIYTLDLLDTSITVIEDFAFYCANISKIVLPSELVFIGKSCFSLSSVRDVIIPKMVANIGCDVCKSCPYLKVFNMEFANVKTLPRGALYNSSVKSVILPKNIMALADLSLAQTNVVKINLGSDVEKIGKKVFFNCTSLESVDIANTKITAIEANTFQYSSIASIRFPSTLKEINDFAFANSGLTKLVALSTLSNISVSAFENCTRLKLVDLSRSSVEEFSDRVFAGCSLLYSVIISKHIKKIGLEAFRGSGIELFNSFSSLSLIQEGAFSECPNLMSVDLEKTSIEEVPRNAFLNCKSLKEVILPQSITAIRENAFLGSLVNIMKLGKNLKEIESNAFSYSNLISIDLTKTKLEVIEERCFYKCSSLEEVYFPPSIVRIKDRAFAFCLSLKEADISICTNLTTLENNTFYYSSSLEMFSFPQSLKVIGENAMCGLKVKELKLPSSVDFIGEGAFCELLNAKIVDLSEVKIKTVPEDLFVNATIEELILPNKATEVKPSVFRNAKIQKIQFPESLLLLGNNSFILANIKKVDLSGTKITEIPYFAFYNSSLCQIILPKSIKTICRYAFSKCKNLTEINLLNTEITEIEEHAFSQCRSLAEMSFPNSLTKIGRFAMRDTGIRSFVGTKNLADIGYSAFFNCTSLHSVDLSDTKVKVLENKLFSKCINLTMIKLPEITEIMNLTFSFISVKEFVFGPSLTKLQFDAFYFSRVERVDLSKTKLTNIGSETFYMCHNLTEVILPKTVTTIGKLSFANSSLTTLNFPPKLEVIDEFAFFGCRISNVNLSCTKVEKLERCAFALSSLRNFVTSESLVSISSECFAKTNITSFVGNKKLKEIGQFSFVYCTELTIIDLKKTSITSIPAALVSNCTNLTTFLISDRVTTLGSNALYQCAINEYKFGSSISVIGQFCFAFCAAEVIDLSKTSVVAIEDGLFYNCARLSKIILPSSSKITKLGIYSFSGTNISTFSFNNSLQLVNDSIFEECNNLKSVDLSSTKIKIIPNRMFCHCRSLTKVKLPKTIEVLGKYAFAFTQISEIKLKKNITVSEGTFFFCEKLTEIDLSYIQNTELPKSLLVNCTSLEKILLPKNMKKICAFGLSSIRIKTFTGTKKLEKLEKGAFAMNRGLTKVDLSETKIIRIPRYCFIDCYNLTEIFLPKSIREIGKGSFSSTGIRTFVAPENLDLLEPEVFYNSSLSSADFSKCQLSHIEERCFLNSSVLTKVIVPFVEKFGNYCFANTTLSTINFSKNVVSIGVGCFSNTFLMECDLSMTFITVLENYTFYGCEILRKVILPKTVTVISDYTFSNCSLKQFTFDGLTTIGVSAFAGSDIAFADLSKTTIKSLSPYCFFGCDELRSVILPKIDEIGDAAFGRSGIKSINIPVTVKKLGEKVFTECNRLESIDLSNIPITEIPRLTFEKCYVLRWISLPITINTICDDAFKECLYLKMVSYCGINNLEKSNVTFRKKTKVFVNKYYSFKVIGNKEVVTYDMCPVYNEKKTFFSYLPTIIISIVTVALCILIIEVRKYIIKRYRPVKELSGEEKDTESLLNHHEVV